MRRLMLCAVSFVLLVAITVSAQAATEISSGTSTALTTASNGDITIDSAGSVAIQTSSAAAVTLNSNNFVLNNGSISNTGVDSAIGLAIDTSAGNILSPSTGFLSTGTIDVSGDGTAKRGIIIEGGHTFYGPVTLSSLTATAITGATATTQTSSLLVKGDNSAGIDLVQGTTITSNLLLAGGGIIQNASTNSTASNSIMVDLDGTLNGNFVNNSALSGVGAGMIGVQTLGGIHSCAGDVGAPSGFTCPSSSGGSFVNTGSISLTGTSTVNSRGGNPESSSAVIIGGSIDGGFLNAGPGTSNNTGFAIISSSGLIASGVAEPTILIDPSKSAGTSGTPRAAVLLGPMTADIDSIDPGYSFTNRGNISAKPLDTDLSTSALIIQGESSTYYTCLSAAVGSCSTTPTTVTQAVTDASGNISNVTYQRVGGILDTGAIAASATTGSQTLTSSGTTSATAIYIGAFATVPRLDVKAETVSASTNTSGSISASVSGVGQGSALGVIIGQNATLPLINVGKNASIVASVTTITTSPTKNIATSSAPFSLESEAILDQSDTLATINNSGTIQATTTTLNPGSGASVVNIRRAIDLSASTIGGIQISNSGRILGDVLFGSSGNGDELDVGNITASGNPVTGVVNTPGNYAIVAEDIISQTSGFAPTTDAALLDFGSGTGQTLHVGGFGYVNAVINTRSAGELAIQVDPDGQLFIANTTSSVQASTLNVAANGTLGLAISEQNLNSPTPVVQAASSAALSGANIGLQFGTYIAASDPATPTTQTVTLIKAPVITDTTLAAQNILLGQNTPFLFESPASANVVAGDKGPTPLTIGTDSGEQTLLLHLLPRSVNATNPDGSPGLNLSGSAKSQFPFTTAALSTDNELGAAVAASLTVYKTPGVPSSGINVVASQQQAQQVFSQFAPDVSGGTREIAILLTDQATGPVAARQRLLRSYSDRPGDMTLWGEEFTGQINNKGQVAGDGTLTSYKDHGFGFTLGMDGGSPRNGWYGGAFTFYSGDVSQQLPRSTVTETQWYMLTGYTNWNGKHVFLDTQLSAAYGSFTENRTITVGNVFRDATSKRPGAMVALGANTGVMLKYSGIEVDPHVSLDGLTMREEGYDEANGGSGFNLDVAPYFASSLRSAIGADIKGTINIWDIDLTPEANLGYRYDLLQQAVKIKAAFDSTGGLGSAGNTMTFIGPDPDKGNTILGLSLGAGTDSWHLGVHYDWVHGDNGSVTQVGIISVLGRI